MLYSVQQETGKRAQGERYQRQFNLLLVRCKSARYGVYFWFILILMTSALAESFDAAPSQYAVLVNRNLVGTGTRIELVGCQPNNILTCNFDSLRVRITVQGATDHSRITSITIVADLMQEQKEDPQATLEEAMLVFSATIMAFDPDLLGSRRAKLLSKLVETALRKGRAKEDGFEARYTARFDTAADGHLRIVIVPRSMD